MEGVKLKSYGQVAGIAVAGVILSISLLALGCTATPPGSGLVMRTARASISTVVPEPDADAEALASVRALTDDQRSIAQLKSGLLARYAEGFVLITNPLDHLDDLQAELEDDSGSTGVYIGNDTYGSYSRLRAGNGVRITQGDDDRWEWLTGSNGLLKLCGHGYILYVRNDESNSPIYNVTGRITSATARNAFSGDGVQAWVVAGDGVSGWPAEWEIDPGVQDPYCVTLGGGEPGDWPLKFWQYGLTPGDELPTDSGQPGYRYSTGDTTSYTTYRRRVDNGLYGESSYFTEAIVALEWPWPPAEVYASTVTFTVEVAWWE